MRTVAGAGGAVLISPRQAPRAQGSGQALTRGINLSGEGHLCISLPLTSSKPQEMVNRLNLLLKRVNHEQHGSCERFSPKSHF